MGFKKLLTSVKKEKEQKSATPLEVFPQKFGAAQNPQQARKDKTAECVCVCVNVHVHTSEEMPWFSTVFFLDLSEFFMTDEKQPHKILHPQWPQAFWPFFPLILMCHALTDDFQRL